MLGGAYSMRQTFLYNPATNIWKTLPSTNIDQGDASLIQLGKRIFVVGGLTTTTEEFNLNTLTWSTLSIPTKYLHRAYASVMALPADWFANRPGGCRGIF